MASYISMAKYQLLNVIDPKATYGFRPSDAANKPRENMGHLPASISGNREVRDSEPNDGRAPEAISPVCCDHNTNSEYQEYETRNVEPNAHQLLGSLRETAIGLLAILI
jgi:hypothetical protein